MFIGDPDKSDNLRGGTASGNICRDLSTMFDLRGR